MSRQLLTWLLFFAPLSGSPLLTPSLSVQFHRRLRTCADSEHQARFQINVKFLWKLSLKATAEQFPGEESPVFKPEGSASAEEREQEHARHYYDIYKVVHREFISQDGAFRGYDLSCAAEQCAVKWQDFYFGHTRSAFTPHPLRFSEILDIACYLKLIYTVNCIWTCGICRQGARFLTLEASCSCLSRLQFVQVLL